MRTYKPYRNNLTPLISQLVAGGITILGIAVPSAAILQGESGALSTQSGAANITSMELPRHSVLGQGLQDIFEPVLVNLDSRLYDAQGNVLANFEGEFQALTPDEEGLITYSDSTKRSHLYLLDGTEQAHFEGQFQQFTPDGQGLATYADGKSRLYNLKGDNLGELSGGYFRGFTPDGNWMMAGTETEIWLCRLDGTQPYTLAGYFSSFTPDEQGMIVYDREAGWSYLYSFAGAEIARYEGAFLTFTQDAQGLATHDYNMNETMPSRLYSLDGRLQLRFPGYFRALSADGEHIITSSDRSDETFIYDRNGVKQATVEGDQAELMADGRSFITYSPRRDRTWLYNFEGVELATFQGRLAQKLAGDQVIFSSSPQERSRLYRLDGTQLQVFEGKFSQLTPDGQGLVTGYFLDDFPGLPYGPYRLYHLDGTLRATFEEMIVGFTPDGQGVISTADGQTIWQNLDGGEQRPLEGIPLAFTPVTEQLLTYSPEIEQFRLYSQGDDNPVVFVGHPQAFTADAQKIVATLTPMR